MTRFLIRSYNGFGQLEGIAGIGDPASFAYRPDGLRYSKTVGSGSAAATHIHLWDGQNIVAEVGATGALNTRYIRGTGLIAREADSALQYYLFDAHGDVLHRLDASGNMLKTYRYDAFGNEIDPEPLDTNPFRYCGEYFDREIGTYYLRARNYDPRIGRFTTEDVTRTRKTNIFDPYGDYQSVDLVGGISRDEEKGQYVVEDPQGLNYYTYCQNNPVRFSDPFGKFVITTALVIAIAGSTLIGAGIGALNAYTSGTSVAGGAIGGGLAGLGMGIGVALFPAAGILAGFAASAFGGGLGSIVEGMMNGNIDPMDVAFDALLNGAFGIVGGGLSKLMAPSFTKIGGAFADNFFSWIFGHVQMSISKIKDILFPQSNPMPQT